MEHHLGKVAEAVEAACDQGRRKPLAEMIKQVVEAFVDVKIERADISVALYQVAPDIGGPALVKKMTQRLRKSIETMLFTAPDIKLQPDKFSIDMMLAAMSGAMRSVLESEGRQRLCANSANSLFCFANRTWRPRPPSTFKLRPRATFRRQEFTRTAPGCCCLHVPELAPRRPCL